LRPKGIQLPSEAKEEEGSKDSAEQLEESMLLIEAIVSESNEQVQELEATNEEGNFFW
jgi:hypothetical protein